MKTFAIHNLSADKILLYSTIALLILSPILSLILGFANIPKLKNLKGWKPTAAFIISAILLVLFNETIDSILGRSADTLFAIVVLGSASLLLIRSLIYLVQSTRFKAISLALTIFLSLFSGGLFFLLFLGAYRFISGEGGLGVGVFAAFGGILISAISLVVNVVNSRRILQEIISRFVLSFNAKNGKIMGLLTIVYCVIFFLILKTIYNAILWILNAIPV